MFLAGSTQSHLIFLISIIPIKEESAKSILREIIIKIVLLIMYRNFSYPKVLLSELIGISHTQSPVRLYTLFSCFRLKF
jgi:hypothetical protein